MRVIVAGSSDWPYPLVVHRALRMCADTAKERGERLTVAHGGYRTGAEADADAWTSIASTDRHLTVDPPERWPIHWTAPCRSSCHPGHRKHSDDGSSACPQAAFHRTDDMFAAGADLLLAFIAHDVRNPEHCIRVARQRGITYQEFAP